MEKKIEFQNRLKEVDNLLRELLRYEDVLSSTALYAFLLSADTAVSVAISHVNELKDISVCNE